MKLLKNAVIVLFILTVLLTGYSMARRIFIVDQTIPEIAFDDDTLDVSVSDGEEALLTGLMAYDEKDGSLTSNVFLERTTKLIDDGTVRATYVVFDEDGNVGKASRYIHYTDYHAPRFALSYPLIYNQGSAITLTDRLSASDVLDGDITYKISVDNQNVTTGATGSYELTAYVTNSLGDYAFVTLPVLVMHSSRTQPMITLKEYLIYIKQGKKFNASSYIEKVVLDGAGGSESSIADNVIIDDNEVDVSVPGTYNVYYTAKNSDKETGTAILTVVVQ